MKFLHRILLEHSIKYAVLLFVAVSFWNDIRDGLQQVSEAGNLDSLALLMSIIALASVSGYFAFSYTQVAKHAVRFWGYLTTLFLGVSITLSLIIIYFIAVTWIPQMAAIWAIIFGSLFLGIALFDNLDLLRMGLDVSASRFFDRADNISMEGKEVHLITKKTERLI